MSDLMDGATVEVKGSGSRPWVIKNVGGVYSCTCPAWRNQSQPPHLRTCKHIRAFRGDAAEQTRLGAAALLPPPRSSGEEKEGPPVLLAESWDSVTSLVGWWMSEKLDGARAYWDGKQFISRLGNTFLAPDWFLDGLPSVPLDGELWVGRKAFQRTMSIIRRIDRPDEWKTVRFVVFDAPQHGGEFEARHRFLGDLLGRNPLPHISLIEQQVCRGHEHLHAELERIEALGGEGLMLRQPGSPYVAGRSSTLLKVKRFHDSEARVIGHLPGQGKHKGRVGALDVELPSGVRFSVGTGLSDAQRSSPPPIGSVITFRYQELSEAGVPRFPSFVGVRPDGQFSALPAGPALAALAAIAALHEGDDAEDAPPATTVRSLTYTTPERSAFWEASQMGSQVLLRFGSGADTRTKSLSFASEQEAQAAVEELLADKLADGFVEPGATPVPTAAPIVVAPDAGPVPASSPAPVATGATAVPGGGGKRHFECVEGSASKFWEVWTDGKQMLTRYGRIGSKGSTTLKEYGDEAAARRAMDKLIAEKMGKGYAEKPLAGS